MKRRLLIFFFLSLVSFAFYFGYGVSEALKASPLISVGWGIARSVASRLTPQRFKTQVNCEDFWSPLTQFLTPSVESAPGGANFDFQKLGELVENLIIRQEDLLGCLPPEAREEFEKMKTLPEPSSEKGLRRVRELERILVRAGLRNSD